MTMTSLDFKKVSNLLQTNIRDSSLPQPEEPCFMPYYDTRQGKWTAQIGSNFAGWYETQAIIPVYLGEYFTTLEGLLRWMKIVLTENQN